MNLSLHILRRRNSFWLLALESPHSGVNYNSTCDFIVINAQHLFPHLAPARSLNADACLCCCCCCFFRPWHFDLHHGCVCVCTFLYVKLSSVCFLCFSSAQFLLHIIRKCSSCASPRIASFLSLSISFAPPPLLCSGDDN